MDFKQLKEWVNSIPEDEFGDLNIVFRTFEDVDEEHVAKIDDPIVSTYIDIETHEICFMNQKSSDKFEDLLKDEDDGRTPINIWDDYHDDEGIPVGETQETFLMVDDGGERHMDVQRKILREVEEYIEYHCDYPEITMELKVRNTYELYPSLPENMHSVDWRLFITNLTHQRREELVDDLNNSGLNLNVYSES